MRDEITISLIGPLPRSHSPACDVKSLNFIKQLSVFSWQLSVNASSAFSLPNLIAELGGAFVVFGFNGSGQFLA